MKRPRILISGYYGFGNAGDEAMLTAILGALYEREPNAVVTVISGNPARTRETHGVQAISRLAMPRILREVSRCDLLISGGGSLLQDVTSKRSLYYYLGIIRLALWCKKPVFLYAQGIGPLFRPAARNTVRDVLNRTQAITVRDKGSQELLTELGVTTPPIAVTADAVLAMHPGDPDIGRMLMRRYGVCGVAPKIGVSVRQWPGNGQYKHKLAQACDELQHRTEGQIIFVPMQYPEDKVAAEDIASAMKKPAVVLDEAYTTAELMGIIGAMDVVIGIRLHALIFAALMGVPSVGISYDPKVDRFLESVGEKAIATIDNVDADALAELTLKRLQQGISDTERKQVAILRSRSEATADYALRLLGREKHNDSTHRETI